MKSAYQIHTRFGFDSSLSVLSGGLRKRIKLTIKKIIVSILIVNMTVPYGFVALSDTNKEIISVEAANRSLSSVVDWQFGEYAGTETDNDFEKLQLESAGNWEPRNITHPEWTMGAPGQYVADENYIYVLRGTSDNEFYRYSPANDEWKALPRAPKSVSYGNMELINGEIYVIFGNNQSDFYKYTIATQTWTRLADYPEIVGQTHMTSDGVSMIYATRGNTEIFKYDIDQNSWAVMPLFTTSNANGDLAYYDGYLYHLWSTIGSEHRWVRYNVNTGVRENMANAPLTLNESNPNWVTVGTNLYVVRSGSTNNFLKYDFVANTWSNLVNMPVALSGSGAVYSQYDGYIYIFRGSTQDVWKYNIATNQLVGVNDVILAGSYSSVGRGSDSFYANGKWYVLRATNTRTLLIYDVATGVWSTGADSPAGLQPIYQYTKGALVNGVFYFLLSGNPATAQFVKYTIATNTWTQLADAPVAVTNAIIGYPGSGDYLYVMRGSSTVTAWRYSIAGNTWDDAGMPDLPSSVMSGIGASFVGDGTDVWLTLGGGLSGLYQFDISANTWISRGQIPMAPLNGSDMVYDGQGRLLMTVGDYGRNFWEYTIATGAWRQLKEMPGGASAGWGVSEGSSIESDGAGNIFVTRGAGSYHVMKYVQSNENYVTSGTWVSQALDLGYVTSWTDLNWTGITPGNSSVVVQTMTSADGVAWSGWQNVSGNTVASPIARFIKIRAALSSSTDKSVTPQIDSLTINYVGDVNPPSNPNTLTSLSTELGGVALTTGETYGYINPYFDWSGASDSESNIKGYYVYFGQTSDANPVTSGGWQTSSSYYVTEPMQLGRYYLRIVVEDMVGNRSTAWPAFEYVYSGISADKQVVLDSSNVLATGSATRINTLNNEIKLASKSAGVWLQDRLTLPPVAFAWGSAISAYVESTGKMYVLTGNSNNRFFEYDVANDLWTELAVAPGSVTLGGGIIEGPDGYLYALQGNNTNVFWRYSIVNNEWDDGAAADAPQTGYYGTSMTFDGERYIYMLRGNSDDAFYSYDTWTDVWTTLTNIDFGAPGSAPNNFVYNGGDLIMGEAGKIYAIGGNTQSSFAVYDITGNDWTVLNDLPVAAQQGANIVYDSATNKVYYAPGSQPDFFSYDVVAGTWKELTFMPGSTNYGTSMRLVGDSIVTIVSSGGTSMWKYRIPTDSWQIPNRGLFGKNFYGSTYDSPSYGAGAIKGDGSFIYLIRGNGASDFVRYDTTTGSTVKMRDLPSGANASMNLAYNSVNNKIYYIPYYLQKMFVYDIATNTWSEDDAPPLMPNQYGSSLIFDGTQYMYWTRGGSNSFYRYDYTAASGSRWLIRANTLAGPGNTGSMTYVNGYIYLVLASTSLKTYRYDTNANTWSDVDMADIPSATYRPYYGSAMAYGGNGYIYLLRGENSRHFLAYSIATNQWSVLPDMPAQVTTGGSLVNGGDNRLYMMPGPGTNTFGDGLYVYVLPTAQSAFERDGVYISGALDLGEVYKINNLRVQYTAAPETSLTIETRTASTIGVWSAWSPVGSVKTLSGNMYEYKINSSAQRYLQYRVSMTSLRGLWSGKVTRLEVNYMQDLTPPSNPEDAGLVVYESATSSAQLSSDNWYPHANIKITWPSEGSASGATDTATGSGILGYHVSFDSSASADPVTAGSLQTTNIKNVSGLVNGLTYYLAIQAEDKAGNKAGQVWRPFVYKYDSQNPSQPSDLTADPSGYSASNNFAFDWTESTDSASGVAAYCYKTGATTGDFATEQCTTDSVVTGVSAYKTGSNTFYVRSRDLAGNTSAYATVSYYFNDDSPSPPRNLEVSTETSTVNSFAFTWQTPEVYYGNAANLRYYYTVNALPSPANVSETALTYLMAGPYATLPGKNTLYVVAKDEAGNIDYDQYASVSFYANTPAPGLPLNMDIADVSVKVTESWKLAITWQEPGEGAENVATYQIWRSADAGETFTKVAATAGISYVDTNLEQIIYQYKVKACDSANNCGAFGEVVEKYPDGKFTTPAELVDEPETSSVTTKKATVNWVTSRTSDSKVAYGVESGKYFDEEVGNSDQLVSHKITLTNLAPGTKYYYVAKWSDEDGNLGTSDEMSFETTPAPSAKEVKVTNLGLESVTVQFTSNGASKAIVVFGKSAAFGGSVEMAVSSVEAAYAILLDGLEDGTKYYYRVDLYDIDGAVYSGDIYSFETLPRPKIENVRLQQVRGTATSTVLVTWNSNTEISSIATYYPTTNPTQAKDEISLKLTKSHKILVRGLSSDTPYTLVIKGRDKGGNEAVSAAQAFTTASDNRPPDISNLNTEVTIQGVGEEATAQLIVSWDTDELSTSQVVFGDGSSGPLSSKTQVDESLTYKHLVVIPNLSPSKVYHFKAMSEDKSDNIAESVDTVVITPKATQSALNLVVGNLSQAFGFLGGLVAN